MKQVGRFIGPGFALLPAPSYGRTTEFLKRCFVQQAGYFCYLHPTVGQLGCYETCSQPPWELQKKQNTLQVSIHFHYSPQHAAIPSCLSIHSQSTKDRAQREAPSPFLPSALPSREPGCGWEPPWAARGAGVWRAVQPTPLTYLQPPSR